MSAISLKSITGITSITTPAGVDDVFTVHSNDTTERFRVDSNGNQVIAGILTVTQDLNVDGHTNLDNVSVAGVTTITSSTYPLVVHADTAYQGILVNGNGAPTIGFNVNDNSTPSWKAGLSGSSHLDFAISQGTGNSNRFTLKNGGGGGITGYFTAEGFGMDEHIYHLSGNDTDTRIRFPGADTFSIDTNGVERLRINSTGITTFTGNVFLSKDLDVDGHTNLDNVSIVGVTTFNGLSRNDVIRVRSADSNGNSVVNILSEGTTGNSRILFSDTAATSGDGWISYSHNDRALTFTTAGTSNERLRIDSTGRVLIGSTSNNTSNKVGDSALQVYTSDQKHPAIRTTAPNANGYTMFSDAYKSDESQVNIGVSYSSAKLVLSTSVKPSDTADNTYISSQDTFSARPCALTMNHQGVLQFLNTTTNATTTTDSAVSLTERFRINSDGQLIHTANKASGYIAEFHQNNSSNSAQILIDSPTNSASRPSFIELSRAGTLQWSIGQGYNESTGSFHFATTSLGSGVTGSKFSIEGDGDIAIPTVGAKIYTNNSGGNLTIQGGASYPGSGIKFNGGTNGGTGVMHFYAGQTSSLQERLRIAADGQVSISSDGTTDGLLTIKGNSDQVGTPSIRLLDGSDTREVSISNTSGDFVASVHGNDNAIHGHIKMFESGIIDFNNGGATGSNVNRIRISTKGQFLHGNTSEDQGWAVFFNAVGSGADAGTAGADAGGDKGVNIRTDMGPTHLDLDGVDNFTLKLANQAYAGAGIANPNGTVSKILFNTVTYNGWNSYGAIALQSQGASSSKGEMVFMLNNGTSSMNEKMRIKSTYIQTANGTGMEIYGQNVNHPNDTVLYVHKTGNADWCIKAGADGYDYGIYSRVANNASYSIGSYDTTNGAWRLRINGAGAIYATSTNISSISDVRLKENIVDANSQWNDIKALRFRNYNWKSDSGYADGKTYLGLIAQEVEPISPNLIEIDAQNKEDIENGVTDPEYKTVKYSIVWMKAVKALQEAQARIEQLEAKVSALEGS